MWRCRSLIVLAVLLSTGGSAGAWAPDGIPLSAELDSQFDPRIAPDGMGGAVLSWCDVRAGNQDIYAQRFNSAGTMLWGPNGIPVCTEASRQGTAVVVASGGGSIIAWTDQRNGGGQWDIYAQRIDADGVRTWTSNGIALSTASFDQVGPAIVSDGADGAIVVWADSRSGDLDVYAQRVRPDGTVLWAANGVPVVVMTGTQTEVSVVPTDGGGAIVVWRDGRVPDGSLYAQRLAADGSPMWTLNGRPVTSGARIQGNGNYDVTTDEAGGCIVAWHDLRTGAPGIYAQRLLANGDRAWPEDVPMTLLPITQGQGTQISSDGNGGAVVAWEDHRQGGGNIDIYAQRVDPDGVVYWPTHGVAVIDTTGTQLLHDVTLDPRGTIVTVRDARSGDLDLYVQLLDPAGSRQWGRQGRPVCTAPGIQAPARCAPSPSGGIYIVWTDHRNDPQGDLYAGYTDWEVADVGTEEPDAAGWDHSLSLLPNTPNPFRVETLIRYVLSRPESRVQIEVFDPRGRRVWRSEQESVGAGHHSIPFRIDLEDGTELSAGIYPYRIRAADHAQTGRIVIVR